MATQNIHDLGSFRSETRFFIKRELDQMSERTRRYVNEWHQGRSSKNQVVVGRIS